MTADAPRISQTENPPAPSGGLRFQEIRIEGYPQLRDLFAIPSVAITVVIMAFNGLIGTYPILVFYALWLTRVLYKGRFVLRPTRDIIAPVLFVAYALLSVLWSDFPLSTLRPALELVSMIACTIIMARIVSIEAYVKGLIIGTALILIATLINGSYGKDAFSDNYSLTGLFGSKNQVGLFAEIGVFSSVIFFLADQSWLQKFLYSLCPLGLFVFTLFISHSGGSIASLALVLFGLFAVRHIINFSPPNRKIVLIIIAALALIAAAIGLYLGADSFFLQVLGKDSTLTGRTYLWAEGIKNGLKSPVFGHGYSAFWVPGRLEAEKYWFKFGINNRFGFHFHNLYIETFVELGAIGLALMLYMIISNCIKSLRHAIRHGSSLKTFFCTGIALMLLIRAFVEVDFLGSFNIGCLLFYSLSPLLANEPDAKPALAPPRRPFGLPLRRSV